MAYLAQAEIAGGEILVFEVALDRHFGFSDADVIVAGVSADANVAGSTAAASMLASGIAQMLVGAAGSGGADVAITGQGAAQFGVLAVQKISADFGMHGMASWLAGGVTFTPHSVLGEDNTRRLPEFRATLRACEHRVANVLASPSVGRSEEHRGVTR